MSYSCHIRCVYEISATLCFLEEEEKISSVHDLADPLLYCWLQGLLPFIHIFNYFFICEKYYSVISIYLQSLIFRLYSRLTWITGSPFCAIFCAFGLLLVVTCHAVHLVQGNCLHTSFVFLTRLHTILFSVKTVKISPSSQPPLKVRNEAFLAWNLCFFLFIYIYIYMNASWNLGLESVCL